jgi:hypothetical protein
MNFAAFGFGVGCISFTLKGTGPASVRRRLFNGPSFGFAREV